MNINHIHLDLILIMKKKGRSRGGHRRRVRDNRLGNIYVIRI